MSAAHERAAQGGDKEGIGANIFIYEIGIHINMDRVRVNPAQRVDTEGVGVNISRYIHTYVHIYKGT